MQLVAVGFWGAFFGCASLVLLAALFAFTRSARRVALTGAFAVLLSAAYVLVYLGWVPLQGLALQRLQALVGVGTSTMLGFLLFVLLGTVRRWSSLGRARLAAASLVPFAFGAAWLAPPQDALYFAAVVEAFVVAAAFAAALASSARSERAGRLALVALPFMSTTIVALGWHVFQPAATPWQVHALGAVSGIGYLLCMATAMWTRYAYLLEVTRVMTQGPDFDPVTRMPTYGRGAVSAATLPAEARPVGVIAVAISNLKMVEELHGRAASNHALFVCASRLRRMALAGVEIGRLHDDGFVLLMRNPRGMEQVAALARAVLQRLSRPVMLGMQQDIAHLESSRGAWQANLGVGLMFEPAMPRPELAVASAQAMARSAWAFPSRLACYDEAEDRITELPTA